MRREDPAVRLLVALDRGDELALASVLKADVRLVVDAGDESSGELRGRAHVVRALRERLQTHPDVALQPVHVNGRIGLALCRHDGEVIGVLSIDGAASIDTLWLAIAPAKLAHWNHRPPDIE